ncbi:MAG: Rrf2 family transcriptional regulator [Candidatus Omnitrophota bacterium]
MKLSTKSTYGLRAMVDIALGSRGGAIPISDIARREGLSTDYLEQLLNKLRRDGLVLSVRGPKGGYLLSKKPDDITVGDIVKALEKDMAPVHCVTADGRPKGFCKRSKDCVTKGVWMKLSKSINDCLDSMTLEDLCGKAAKAPARSTRRFL